MAELALGALGLVPLIGSAHTSIRAAKRKFKSFQNYSGEVRRICNSLDIEKASFRNQTRLVLQLALGDRDSAEDIEAILDCRDGAQASRLGLEEKLAACLADSYEAFRAVFEQISADIDCLEQQLDGYESPYINMEPERKDRLKAGLKYAFRESKCKELLTSLRASNGDLERLRKERLEISQPRTSSSRQRNFRGSELQATRLGQEFDSFLKIRSASRSMHHALSTTYAAAKTQTRHCARLFINALRERDDVTCTIMLLCRCDDSTLAESRLCLQVISRNKLVDSGVFTPDSTETRPTVRRRVRFADDLDPEAALTTLPSPCSAGSTTLDRSAAQQQRVQMVNLGRSVALCSDLRRRHQAHIKGKGRERQLGASHCVGFIDSMDDFRHTFFGIEDNTKHPQLQGRPGDFVPLDCILNYDLTARFTPVDQLRLAHSVSSAFLKFLNTPWMPEILSTRSLFFVQDRANLKRGLRTLHLRADTTPDSGVCQESREGEPIGMDGLEGNGENNETDTGISSRNVLINREGENEDNSDADGEGLGANSGSSSALSTAMLEHGVKSLPLFSLAVILLQIDRWTRVHENDIVEVRRLAYRSASRLGPRYDRLVLKCLECEFEARSSTGRRLHSIAKPRLQDSVYREVVCELSELIRATGALDLDGGE